MYLQYIFQLHRQKNRSVKYESESTLWNQLTVGRGHVAHCLLSGDPCSFIEKGVRRIEKGIELVHLIEGEAIMKFWGSKIKNIYIFLYVCNNKMFIVNVFYV